MIRDYWAWFVLRFLMGMGISLLFTAGDTWVNSIVEDRVRGRWLGIYSTVGMAGWAVGPIMGSMMDPESWWPFVAGLTAITIATFMLMPTRRIDIRLSAQADHDPGRGKLVAVLFLAPTVLLSSAMFGIVEGSVQSFAHLYTMDLLGQQFRSVGYAVIWVASVGAIFFQFPVGWLADKMDRGWLLVICVAVLLVMVSLLPLLIGFGADPWYTPGAFGLWASLSIWGGAMGAIFTVGITLLGERFRGVELVAANAVFSVLFGIGGLVGPFIVGAAMEHVGSRGYPLSLAVTVLAYLLFAAYRQYSRTGLRGRR
jgi:MFS family permease